MKEIVQIHQNPDSQELVELKTKYPVKFVKLENSRILVTVGSEYLFFGYPDQPALLILSDTVRAYISSVYPSDKPRARVRVESSPKGYSKVGSPLSTPEELVKYKQDSDVIA